MHVAAIQFKANTGQKAEALDRLEALIDQACEQPRDLVVLPEMAATRYLFADVGAVAEVAEPPEGPTFQRLSPLARRHQTWLVAGFAEAASEGFYNSAMILSPDGELHHVYRKRLLFEADEFWARPGRDPWPLIDTGAGRFTVGICMDLNDDAFVQWCHQARAEAIAFPTNWLDQGMTVWHYWAWRLHQVPSALVAANTYGPEGPIRFSGCSAVLQDGHLLARTDFTGDRIVTAQLPEFDPAG